MRKHHESTEQMRRGQYHGYRGKRYPGGVNEMPGKARDGVTNPPQESCGKLPGGLDMGVCETAGMSKRVLSE